MYYNHVGNLLHFIHEGIGYSRDHAAEVARASYVENKLHEHRTRAGRSVLCPIVLDNDGDEDEDDTARLSELIALAEMGLQAEEVEDNTGRLSELIALTEAGLQTEKDDDTFFTQSVDEAEAAYDRQHGGQSNVGEPSHMNEEEEKAFLSQAADEAEAAYYRLKADQGNAGEPSHSKEVVVEDWYSYDELLTQYVSY